MSRVCKLALGQAVPLGRGYRHFSYLPSSDRPSIVYDPTDYSAGLDNTATFDGTRTLEILVRLAVKCIGHERTKPLVRTTRHRA